MPQPLSSHAAAKINLFLHITGKRADGYHLLDSLVVFTQFGDRVEVEEAGELSLEVKGALNVPKEQNLVWKAAVALQQLAPSRGARIVLHKHIPVGAGLGGGSADAAVTLRLLSQLWQVDVPDNMALQLGSDVPVCMRSTAAIMRGIGEKLTPVSLGVSPYVVLVNPNMPLATADVFRAFRGGIKNETAITPNIQVFAELVAIVSATENMLEAPAVSIMPVIGDILVALRHTPGCVLARMSGSGATCFGLYETKQQAEAAKILIQSAYPAWWVVDSMVGM